MVRSLSDGAPATGGVFATGGEAAPRGLIVEEERQVPEIALDVDHEERHAIGVPRRFDRSPGMEKSAELATLGRAGRETEW